MCVCVCVCVCMSMSMSIYIQYIYRINLGFTPVPLRTPLPSRCLRAWLRSRWPCWPS